MRATRSLRTACLSAKAGSGRRRASRLLSSTRLARWLRVEWIRYFQYHILQHVLQHVSFTGDETRQSLEENLTAIPTKASSPYHPHPHLKHILPPLYKHQHQNHCLYYPPFQRYHLSIPQASLPDTNPLPSSKPTQPRRPIPQPLAWT